VISEKDNTREKGAELKKVCVFWQGRKSFRPDFSRLLQFLILARDIHFTAPAVRTASPRFIHSFSHE
jgi:hypothetical protein